MYRLIFSIILLPTIVFCRIESTRLNFYPLQIGNEWIYKSISYEYSATGLDTIDIDTIYTKITSDTIMPNGERYYFITGADGGFRRIDSLALKVFQYDYGNSIDSTDEYLIYDLTILDSLNWIDGLGNTIEIKTSEIEKSVGYLNEKAIQTEYVGAYYYNHRVLSEGFGLSYLHYGCMLPATINILIGAKINGIEYSIITNIESGKEKYPIDFKLNPIYLNPFNASTRISFNISIYSNVVVTVYNSLGQMKQLIINQYLPPGNYKINWDASSFESGLYFIKFESNNYVETQKCLLLK